MNAPPTIRDLAKMTGFSQTAVSLALRNHPRISLPTREKIQALANKVGYTRNPVVSTLMTQLRSARKNRSVEKLALLTWWDKPGAVHNLRGQAQLDGIHERARQLGYEVEEFWARQPRMTGSRLSRILHARSIRGVLCLSMLRARGHLSLPWKDFAVAAVSHAIINTDLHRSLQDHFQGMMITLRNLRRLGYARIGYANLIEQDDMTENQWLAAYVGGQYRARSADIIPPLLLARWDRTKLGAWLEKHRIDAVVSNLSQVMELARDLGYRVPEDLGFASLDCLPGVDSWAGIDVRRQEVGASAVDLVVEQMQNNEFGRPRYPKAVRVEGVWHDGSSVRRHQRS